MKLLLLTWILLLIPPVLHAQREIPEFGIFTSEEQAIKECDFDKDADAIILFDIGNSNYNEAYNLITTRRIRFKILKQKGIDKADIDIPYFSKEDFESISNIRAITHTLEDNGEIVTKELDKKVVFRQKINDRVSLLKFTLPNIKVGTIVDYEYETSAKTYGGLDDWYFQSDMPVMLSRYTLTMIPNAEFTYVVHKAPDIPVKISSDKRNGSLKFEMNNIAGLRYEPFMNASRDYLQHVEFQLAGYVNRFGGRIKYMTTWKESALELAGAYYFGRLLEKDLADSAPIIAEANAFSAPYDKMKFIYDYVRNNFSWNNIDAKYADEGIKNVWVNKKGTSAEINLILINLLKQSGLPVYPMLVSERDHGKVNTAYPMLDQFNKVVACTIIDSKKFVLDATNICTPVNIIPFNILNTDAFIVNSRNPEVIRLTNTKSASNLVNIYSVIDDNGIIDGQAIINSYDYEKVKRLQDYRENKEKFQHDYFANNYAEIRIDSFEVSNTEIDSLALKQHFKFSMPAAVSGDYKLINLNLFSGFEKNPFTSDNRFTDVDFGCAQKRDVTETFELPSGMKPEEIPKNTKLVSPDNSISFVRMAYLNENVITIQMSFKINQSFFTVEDYPMLKEFYKKMHNLLNEQLVLSVK